MIGKRDERNGKIACITGLYVHLQHLEEPSALPISSPTSGREEEEEEAAAVY